MAGDMLAPDTGLEPGYPQRTFQKLRDADLVRKREAAEHWRIQKGHHWHRQTSY